MLPVQFVERPHGNFHLQLRNVGMITWKGQHKLLALVANESIHNERSRHLKGAQVDVSIHKRRLLEAGSLYLCSTKAMY
jgi:hypothetical protein